MTSTRSIRREPRKHGYTFREGLTMMAANGCGIDPYLAAEAGEDATLSLRALRHALTLPAGPERREAFATAARELRNIDPGRHGELVAAIAERIAEAEGRPAGARPGARTNPATGQQEFAIEEITVTGRRPPRFNIAGPGLFMGGQPNDSLPDGDAFAIRFQNSRAAFLNGLIAQGYKLSPDGKKLIGPNGDEIEIEPETLPIHAPILQPPKPRPLMPELDMPKPLVPSPWMENDPGTYIAPPQFCNAAELSRAEQIVNEYSRKKIGLRLEQKNLEHRIASGDPDSAALQARFDELEREITNLGEEMVWARETIHKLFRACKKDV